MDYDRDNGPKGPPSGTDTEVISNTFTGLADDLDELRELSNARWDLIQGSAAPRPLESVPAIWAPALYDQKYANYDPALTAQGLHFVEKVGQGLSGAVFVVWDEDVGGFLAVKGVPEGTPFAESARRCEALLHEAEITSGINHPNILNAHRVIHGDKGPYLVMAPEVHLDFTGNWQVVRNNDLATEITQVHARKAPEIEALRPLLQNFVTLCDAVSHIHDHGIAHRDLKPANVMLNAANEPVLADFGHAKRFDTARDPTDTEHRFTGTPGFTAPELIRQGSTSPPDTRAEVYALGSILYTILSGSSPFQEINGPLPKLMAALRQDPKPIEALNPRAPTEFIAIARTAMAQDPNDRYQHVSQLREAAQLALDIRERLRLAG